MREVPLCKCVGTLPVQTTQVPLIAIVDWPHAFAMLTMMTITIVHFGTIALTGKRLGLRNQTGVCLTGAKTSLP